MATRVAWTGDGVPRMEVAHVDRLLRFGPARDYLMCWVDVPSLAVTRSPQAYEPLGDGRVRFSSADFTAEIQFDDAGYVVSYPGIGFRVSG